MKTYKLNMILAICLMVIAACKDDSRNPLSDNNSVPSPVINASVQTALAGGAKIVYQLPDDQNILYVKAVYESPKGNFREVKSSLYGTSLIIDGLGTSESYKVMLYTVSRSEKQSKPVELVVNPMTPPVLTTRASLKLTPDFGGFLVDFKNPDEGNIIVTMLTKDNLGDWVVLQNYYTKNKAGQIAATGLPGVKGTFGVFVKDRWNNRSDTLVAELTPLAESQLEKSKFTEHLMGTWNPATGAAMRPLAVGSDWNSNYQNRPDTRLAAAWDGIAYNSSYNNFQTTGGAPMPGSFTFNLGVKRRLSRMLYNPRTDNPAVIWSHQGMQDFEVWGTTLDKMVDQRDPSFSSNGWQKLLDCKVVKPSGLPNTPGNITAEDNELMMKGFEFRFPLNTPEVQILRFRVLKTFNSTADWHVAELTFWGQL